MVAEVARHRTALVRGDLSRPLRTARADGLLSNNVTIMDYGCGRGDDVRFLEERNYDCAGWDPVHAPNGARREADVVNLGYVVNVIENPVERRETLQQAWALTRRVLLVSARSTSDTPDSTATAPYSDGCLTRLGTFQKFFDQQELRSWIDQSLESDSVAAAPGIFYVFRDTAERSAFVASRFRRVASAPRIWIGEQLFVQNKAILERLADFVAGRGRLPSPEELPEYSAITEALGNLPRAFRILQTVSEPGAWDGVRDARSQDLLVFVALSRFDRRPRFGELPRDIQLDVKAFFGTYTAQCTAADDLLFSLGQPERLEEAFRTSQIGKLMPNALYVHADAVAELPILLRLYEGCARGYLGTVPGANLVKLGRGEPKVSYLTYPDFDSDPHPALAASVSVNLQTFRVRQRSYLDRRNPPILHRKEQFLGLNHPLRAKFARLTRLEEAKGLFEDPASIGTREGWSRVVAERGFALRGHRLVRAMARLPTSSKPGYRRNASSQV